MGIGTFVSRSNRPMAGLPHQKRISTGDLVLVAAVVALSIFGLLMLYSASTDFSMAHYSSPTFIFNKQVLWFVLGGVAAIVLARLDYHIWQKLALPLMVVTIIALIAVLIAGQESLGAIRSFIGGSVQPSELAKLATVIYLSVWLYSKRDYLHDIQLGLIPLAVILGVLGGLIFKQPDLSAAITVFILGGLLFFLAGGDLRQITLFCLVALAVGAVVVMVSPTGLNRIKSFIAGFKDPLQSSDHVLWSLEAVFKGKFFGVGLGNATTKLIGLPFAATDSIFAVVVEELGFIGVLALIVLYTVVVWRGLVIAGRAPDMLGSVLAGGLTFWIAIEAFINMAVMVNLLPFAGNALPFVSAGGSNLISTLAAIGILLSISRHSGRKAPQEVTEERRSYGASVDLRRRNRRRSVSRARRPGSVER